MNRIGFLEAQGKGMIVAFVVVVGWAALDYVASQIGLGLPPTRSYPDLFFAATAAAAIAYSNHLNNWSRS